MLTNLFNNTKSNSLANYFRRKRFRLFLDIIDKLDKPVKILDAGGTESFWKMMGLTHPAKVNITIINTEEIAVSLPGFRFIKCDARDLSAFPDSGFDIVFSNSVIEHVGGFDEQKKMAGEIIRTGKHYFVQTPHYYIPVEPHFLFPMFQFLPLPVKRFLLMKFNLGWFEKCKTKSDADELISSVKLLKRGEIMKLFPQSTILTERFFIFPKSFIVYK